jgi:predicted metal-dependent hydrolase
MKKPDNKVENRISETTWHDSEDLRWAVRNWSARIGVKPSRVQIRPMSTKWASITTAGSMTLDTDLLSLPKELGEFVIVHELVHLLAPNHGKVFKSFMHAYIPDWEELETQLQTYAKKEDKKKGAPRTRSKNKKS